MEQRFRPERRPWDPRRNGAGFLAVLLLDVVLSLVVLAGGVPWPWALGGPAAIIVPTALAVVVLGWWLHADEELVVDTAAVTLLRRGRVVRRIDRMSPRFSVIRYALRARSTSIPILSFADGTARLRLSEEHWPRSQAERVLDAVDPPEPVRAPFPRWSARRIRDFLRALPMPREDEEVLASLSDDELAEMSKDVPGVRAPVPTYGSPKEARRAHPEHF
ncbi:MAG: hypothetical protein PGN07_05415 [Aeromicrobium erythreum]